jgi:GTP-binding protein
VKIRSCSFEVAAYRPEDYPRAAGPDIVFMGRSNVGKSSMINHLLGAKGLARTSSQPGRTQSVNFYRVNDCCWFVDLPGYGYAKAPEAVRRSWKPMVEGFLDARRERIALALLVVDARHDASPLDKTMLEWLQEKDIPHVVTATKSDKLSGNGRARAAAQLRRELDGDLLLVSARSGLGTKDIWSKLDHCLAEAKESKKGQPWTSRN